VTSTIRNYCMVKHHQVFMILIKIKIYVSFNSFINLKTQQHETWVLINKDHGHGHVMIRDHVIIYFLCLSNTPKYTKKLFGVYYISFHFCLVFRDASIPTMVLLLGANLVKGNNHLLINNMKFLTFFCLSG